MGEGVYDFAVTTTSPKRQPNRRLRLEMILDRDGPSCVWCRCDLSAAMVQATTEHVVPRVKGGPSWLENELAACRRCNGRRGHRTPAEWADECEQLGWQPDRARVITTLAALQDRIAADGGQRRARPYIDSQLRRLRNAV